MIPLLVLIPVVMSFILGIVYVTMEEGRAVTKVLGVAVFLLAAWLQFRSRFPLAGLLLQIGLALTLAIQRRLAAVL